MRGVPDALGEAADVAAADVWPGGTPQSEVEGFNGVIARTFSGVRLLNAAVDAGELVLGDAITPEQFNHFQPHQVTKKVALNARFDALESAGKPVIASQGLRLVELGKRQSGADRNATINGTIRRIDAGRFSEAVETSVTSTGFDDSIIE